MIVKRKLRKAMWRTLFPKTITVLPLFKLPTHWSSLPMDIKDNDGIPFAYIRADAASSG